MVTSHLSEGSFVRNLVVQIPKFAAKPNPNLTLCLYTFRTNDPSDKRTCPPPLVGACLTVYETLANRRRDLWKSFFKKNARSCLRYLLPPVLYCIVENHCLRQVSKIQSLRTRTVHFSNSFIACALNNYQDSG